MNHYSDMANSTPIDYRLTPQPFSNTLSANIANGLRSLEARNNAKLDRMFECHLETMV